MTTTNLIAETQMVAVIPALVAARYAQHGLLVVLPVRVRQAALEPFGSIVRRDRPLSAAASRFLALLHQPVPRAARRARTTSAKPAPRSPSVK